VYIHINNQNKTFLGHSGQLCISYFVMHSSFWYENNLADRYCRDKLLLLKCLPDENRRTIFSSTEMKCWLLETSAIIEQTFIW